MVPKCLNQIPALDLTPWPLTIWRSFADFHSFSKEVVIWSQSSSHRAVRQEGPGLPLALIFHFKPEFYKQVTTFGQCFHQTPKHLGSQPLLKEYLGKVGIRQGRR